MPAVVLELTSQNLDSGRSLNADTNTAATRLQDGDGNAVARQHNLLSPLPTENQHDRVLSFTAKGRCTVSRLGTGQARNVCANSVSRSAADLCGGSLGFVRVAVEGEPAVQQPLTSILRSAVASGCEVCYIQRKRQKVPVTGGLWLKTAVSQCGMVEAVGSPGQSQRSEPSLPENGRPWMTTRWCAPPSDGHNIWCESRGRTASRWIVGEREERGRPARTIAHRGRRGQWGLSWLHRPLWETALPGAVERFKGPLFRGGRVFTMSAVGCRLFRREAPEHAAARAVGRSSRVAGPAVASVVFAGGTQRDCLTERNRACESVS